MAKKNLKAITMKDIAREANVSITTVSHVINKTRFVSEKNKKKVLEIIKKRNFHKSLSASSLRGKRSKLIGVIIPDISNIIYAKLCKEIERAFYKEGYSITVCNSESNFNREIDYLNILKSRVIDGIIIIPTKNDATYLKEIRDYGIPLILIERVLKNFKVDSIIVDGSLGFYNLTKYLIDLGHKKFGYIARPYNLSHSIGRFKGFLKALEDNHIDFNKRFWVKSMGFGYIDGANAMKKLLSREDKPTAVLAYGDTAAIGAIKAVRECGFRVPEDVSIASFDNFVIDIYLSPTLTSIVFPTPKIAELAVNIMLRRLNGEVSPYKEIILKPVLKIRESVSKPSQ